MEYFVRLGGPPIVSTIDWYGKISLVFHFAGCNLRCKFCHNSTLLAPYSGAPYQYEDIVEMFETNAPFVEAVVFTGGEPTMQGGSLTKMCELAREHDLEVMIDTNGVKWKLIQKLWNKQLIHRMALDVKCSYDHGTFMRVTSRAHLKAVRSALQLCQFIPHEVRITMWPEIDIVHILYEIEKYVNELHIQEYDPTHAFNVDWRKPGMNARELEVVGKIAKLAGIPFVYLKTLKERVEIV